MILDDQMGYTSLGFRATVRLRLVDILPDIDVPVVSVIWFYSGMSPEDMADRIVANSESGVTITVNSIAHMESQSVYGMGIVKVFFRPGADLSTAIAQLTAMVQTHSACPAARNDAVASDFL
jgi:multidrug efflux pump subunit AcrB